MTDLAPVGATVVWSVPQVVVPHLPTVAGGTVADATPLSKGVTARMPERASTADIKETIDLRNKVHPPIRAPTYEPELASLPM